MESGIKLIVGLGNPGPQYVNTRHNVGAWFVDALVAQFDGVLKFEAKFKGFCGVVSIANQECKLLVPTTFMNLSGQAVLSVAHFYKIPPESILVVHDELDFLPGIIRLKKGGGAGGHNGVQNIINCLNSKDFLRLRIGIGKPANKDAMLDYVLKSPDKTTKQIILHAIENALSIMPDLITGNIEKAMQELHTNPV